MRYLTQNAQAVMPINNKNLFYTFQGLTSDGKYYVAAVMPLNYPGLPADSRVSPYPPEVSSDYNGYIAGMEKAFNAAPDGAFTPRSDSPGCDDPVAGS